MAPLSTLPRELIDEILSHASEEEIWQLSLCSKQWRSWTSPIIFRCIVWRGVKGASLFAEGGDFAHLRPVVREISMALPRLAYPEELLRTIDTYRILMEAFSHFPYVTRLQIDLYNVLDGFEANIIQAILTKISTSPAFETLQALDIEKFSIGREVTRDFPTPYMALGLHTNLPLDAQQRYKTLPKAAQDFLGPLIDPTKPTELPPMPRRLTKLGVSLSEFTLLPDLKAPPDVNLLINTSAGTLKELRIMANRIIHPRPADQTPPNWIWPSTFSSLTNITIISSGYSLHHIADIGNWLPNVQVLALSDGPSAPYSYCTPALANLLSIQEETLSKAIKKLKSLRRVRLPRLYEYVDLLGIDISNSDYCSKVYLGEKRLEDLVGQWVKAGSSGLEKVVFSIESFTWNGRRDAIFAINIRRGPGLEGGWRLDTEEEAGYIPKPYDRDISL
ncbi:hypothetical protein TWF481_000496 [Arthrobotrys musiformis]|uniref:F-box domain-containing protein n=1 Tax=Arthrobotrys musiformis TaxID=47236 RepID=A0AAV9WMX6_9PEZI